MEEILSRLADPAHFEEYHQENSEIMLCTAKDGECRILAEIAADYSPEQQQQFVELVTASLEAIDRFVGGHAADIFAGLHIKVGENLVDGGAKAYAEENRVFLNGQKMLLSVIAMREVSGAYTDSELCDFPGLDQPGGALRYTLVHELGHILDGQTKAGRPYHRIDPGESPTGYGRTDENGTEAFAEGFAHAVYDMQVSERMQEVVRATCDARLREVTDTTN